MKSWGGSIQSTVQDLNDETHVVLNKVCVRRLKLDPVDSTVRYNVLKLCTGSVEDSNGWY